MRKRTSVIWKVSNFEEIVKKSTSIAEILRSLDLPTTGSLYKFVKKRIKEEKIDDSHIPKGRQSNKGRKFFPKKKPLSEILVLNSNCTNSSVKKRLIEENLLKNHCYKCELGPMWQSKFLSLQLDHINGDPKDNRLENLRLLCPNCHSQTETFGSKNHKYKKKDILCKNCFVLISKGTKHQLCQKCAQKNSRKVERPSKEILLKEIDELGFAGTGRKYNVSDNAIRKWLKFDN